MSVSELVDAGLLPPLVFDLRRWVISRRMSRCEAVSELVSRGWDYTLAQRLVERWP